MVHLPESDNDRHCCWSLAERYIGTISIHYQVALLVWISLPLSLAIHPYYPLLLAGFPDDILCLYRFVVGKLWLVGQHWHIHVMGSIGERHLWVHPCFSSRICLIWLVALFSRICSEWFVALLCSSHLTFSLSV